MNVLVVLGTRPEAIKLWRVIEELKRVGANVTVFNTQQQRQLSETILKELEIPGVVKMMRWSHDARDVCGFLAVAIRELNASLSDPTPSLVSGRPDLVVVQGDTTTALAGALAAFYNKIPVAHVEAGLRTYNLTSPFPEEGNRQMISRIAALHFCPTSENLTNLIDEQIDLGETTLLEDTFDIHGKPMWSTERAFVVGNTGIDALGMVAKSVPAGATDVLVTFHRREAWDYVEELAGAVRKIAQQGHLTTWITHGNPQLRGRVRDAAGTFNASNGPCDTPDGPCACGAWHHPTDGIVVLRDPLGYKDFIRELCGAKVVITDSGGVVEECVTLGRKCIMVRDATERSEALEHGHRLVGLDEIEQLPAIVETALKNWSVAPSDVFGDGCAVERIAQHIVHFLSTRPHGQ